MIQLTALEDWSVSEKQQWDSAVKFMETTLQDELEKGTKEQEFVTEFTYIFTWQFWTLKASFES